MKVLLINGSPRPNGCTFTALSEAGRVLNEQGIQTEVFQIGTGPIRGCIACGSCRKLGRCVFDDDKANELAAEIRNSDGIIVGTPVYYAGANGAAVALLNRAFYSGGGFAGKPAAAIVSCRRAGTTATLDELQKFFTISGMPIVSSTYWNMVHGSSPEDVMKDLEGLQTMRNLGRNMAWMLKCIQAGKREGIEFPEQERGNRTNFIR